MSNPNARPKGRARRGVAAILGMVLSATPAAGVQIDWITIGDSGNAPDPDTGVGAVSDTYRIAETETTNAQYAEFLNAVGQTDPNGLYEPAMGLVSNGGITRSGSTGSYAYAVKPGDGEEPVNYVSFLDAVRFANWLHNGQPTGAQGNATTEDGAYTITAQSVSDNSLARNPGATVFLPDEDEWYKAAYYDASLGLYYDYPAGSDVQTACRMPSGAPNTANCDGAVGAFTDVGSYPGSPSPNGTFDQGGNAYELTESATGSRRIVRGGGYHIHPGTLAATSRTDVTLDFHNTVLGFRVASVPEPATGLLLLTGLLALAASRSVRC